jgi:hypothetical protein
MMNYNYKYEEFDTKGCFQGIGVLLLIVFFVGVTVFSAQETWVTDEAAKAYIQEMTVAIAICLYMKCRMSLLTFGFIFTMARAAVRNSVAQMAMGTQLFVVGTMENKS